MTLFDPEDLLGRAAPTGPLVRVRMTIAYDGSGFRGFAAQAGGVKTVASALSGAVGRVLGHPVELTCAGRTDAGVHAWGQVVHFDSPLPSDALDFEALQRSLNKMLRPSVVVRSAELAPEGFDARRSAFARRYRYTVLNREIPDPFLATTSWHVGAPLDIRAMRAGCDPLLGEHDFASFCRKQPDGGSLIRRVTDARWIDLGEGVLRFDIEASSFCQQMVRSLVGTLVEVGTGKRRAGDMTAILRQQDRSAAAVPAPPSGLCLWEVRYPDLGPRQLPPDSGG